jgi:hypothetical protein
MVCSLQRDVRRLARQRDAQVKGGQVINHFCARVWMMWRFTFFSP